MVKKKDDDMWDDSALVNAMNDAVSKYMKMHVPDYQNRAADEGKEGKGSIPGDQSDGAERHAGESDESTISSVAEIKEGVDCSIMKEKSIIEPEASENHVFSSTEQCIHDEHNGYQFTQSTQEYNQLVNKYYELEDQRQKILLQLNQFGYGNHDYAATTVASQEPQSSTSQAHPAATCSQCPYGCQTWVEPCTSLACCCPGGTFVSSNAPAEVASTENIVTTKGTDFAKAAMVAAERALSTVKERACTNSANEDARQGKQSEPVLCRAEKTTSPETDIHEVINAWYSAGYYTGKYLTEQSFANGSRG